MATRRTKSESDPKPKATRAKATPKAASTKPATKAAGAKTTPTIETTIKAVGRNTASTPVTVTHELIAARAYQLWESKGMPAGLDMQIWIEAERSLRN